jgi:hypothetical protein
MRMMVRRKERSGGGPWVDDHTSVVCGEKALPVSSLTAIAPITRGGSIPMRPLGMGPTGTESHEQMSRIGSLGLDGFGSGFVSPQPHRQTVPAGQQQHALTDSVAPPHVCRSSDIPPIGIASDARMPNTERMTDMLVQFLSNDNDAVVVQTKP